MSPELKWRAVMARDARFDGAFFYGVRSTRIYCRPSCPSRRPSASKIAYFDRPSDAEEAGFRACRRCHPRAATRMDREVRVVLTACRAVETAHDGVTLARLARRAGTTTSKLRRAFERIVGTSPRSYAEAFRMDRMKELLRGGETITGALYGAGYSSPSRVYEDSSARMGMTPGDYRRRGAAMVISCGATRTRLGWLVVAATDKGVCAVRMGDTRAAVVAEVRREFDAAHIEEDDAAVERYLEPLRCHLERQEPIPGLPLDIQATAFQARVWEVLRAIPCGETRSYTDIAQAIGQPTAVRAVARACATNPVALVIPCHRVLREDGSLGGYRWGIERKAALLDAERRETAETPRGKSS